MGIGRGQQDSIASASMYSEPVNDSWCALKTCGKSFTRKTWNQKYCAVACQRFTHDRPRGTMHFARLEKSARLQRVLEVLGDGRAHSTLLIQQQARVCAVGSIIGELRRNGFDIECRYRGMTADGGRIYTYRLVAA